VGKDVKSSGDYDGLKTRPIALNISHERLEHLGQQDPLLNTGERLSPTEKVLDACPSPCAPDQLIKNYAQFRDLSPAHLKALSGLPEKSIAVIAALSENHFKALMLRGVGTLEMFRNLNPDDVARLNTVSPNQILTTPSLRMLIAPTIQDYRPA
jgi:hypothetical protein